MRRTFDAPVQDAIAGGRRSVSESWTPPTLAPSSCACSRSTAAQGSKPRTSPDEQRKGGPGSRPPDAEAHAPAAGGMGAAGEPGPRRSRSRRATTRRGGEGSTTTGTRRSGSTSGVPDSTLFHEHVHFLQEMHPDIDTLPTPSTDAAAGAQATTTSAGTPERSTASSPRTSGLRRTGTRSPPWSRYSDAETAGRADSPTNSSRPRWRRSSRIPAGRCGRQWMPAASSSNSFSACS